MKLIIVVSNDIEVVGKFEKGDFLQTRKLCDPEHIYIVLGSGDMPEGIIAHLNKVYGTLQVATTFTATLPVFTPDDKVYVHTTD